MAEPGQVVTPAAIGRIAFYWPMVPLSNVRLRPIADYLRAAAMLGSSLGGLSSSNPGSRLSVFYFGPVARELRSLTPMFVPPV